MAQTAESRTTSISHQRAIIERPRLIKKLDGCTARTILLLAPAGYGKTTLARQWTATLNRVVWVSLTSAHRDVTVLARDLAHEIEGLGEKGFSDFVDQYLRARENPQAAGRELGKLIAAALDRSRVQWVVLDDVHELAGTEGAERLIDALRSRAGARFLVASRRRPAWADSRELLYGESEELVQDDLAMNKPETAVVLGRRTPGLDDLIAMARGWPAVLTLAAKVDVADIPAGSMLPEALHRFLADELFSSMSPKIQQELTRRALLPPSLVGGDDSSDDELAFALGGDSRLHPLMREFLLAKLAARPGGNRKIVAAVQACIDAAEWEQAFELILRFKLDELVEPAVAAAYLPLARTGRAWTLAEFARALRASHMEAPESVDVIDAETARCEGAFDLCSALASRALRRLPPGHPLIASAALLLGTAEAIRANPGPAEDAFLIARDAAHDDRDLGEALAGLGIVTARWERPAAPDHLVALERRRDISPIDLVRYGINATHLYLGGLGPNVDELADECLHAIPVVRDPRIVASFLFITAYRRSLSADYQSVIDLCELLQTRTESFDLEFARPFTECIRASAHLGLRRFGEAERILQRVEETPARSQNTTVDINIRTLRARLLVQTARAHEALVLVDGDPPSSASPATRAEFAATRAIVQAVLGDASASRSSAAESETMSCGVEPRAQIAAARAIAAADGEDTSLLVALFDRAKSSDVWDALVCALRGSPPLAAQAASVPTIGADLHRLCERTGDRTLARQLGIKVKAASSAASLLSPREREVLGLLSQGLRNGQIARALFISESTVKVHVRHVFDKLGVRTRAEAAARFGS